MLKHWSAKLDSQAIVQDICCYGNSMTVPVLYIIYMESKPIINCHHNVHQWLRNEERTKWNSLLHEKQTWVCFVWIKVVKMYPPDKKCWNIKGYLLSWISQVRSSGFVQIKKQQLHERHKEWQPITLIFIFLIITCSWHGNFCEHLTTEMGDYLKKSMFWAFIWYMRINLLCFWGLINNVNIIHWLIHSLL